MTIDWIIYLNWTITLFESEHENLLENSVTVRSGLMFIKNLNKSLFVIREEDRNDKLLVFVYLSIHKKIPILNYKMTYIYLY